MKMKMNLNERERERMGFGKASKIWNWMSVYTYIKGGKEKLRGKKRKVERFLIIFALLDFLGHRE